MGMGWGSPGVTTRLPQPRGQCSFQGPQGPGSLLSL